MLCVVSSFNSDQCWVHHALAVLQERDDCREVIGELRTDWDERNQEWWEHAHRVREQQREESKQR